MNGNHKVAGRLHQPLRTMVLADPMGCRYIYVAEAVAGAESENLKSKVWLPSIGLNPSSLGLNSVYVGLKLVSTQALSSRAIAPHSYYYGAIGRIILSKVDN